VRILLYSDLSAKWIYYYIEMCKKILHHVCLCLWYTAIACIWAIVYCIYIVYVCVKYAIYTDSGTLKHRLQKFRRTSIDWNMIDYRIAYFLSIDQLNYCLHFVSMSSVKWYWDFNRNMCGLYNHNILCTIVCI